MARAVLLRTRMAISVTDRPNVRAWEQQREREVQGTPTGTSPPVEPALNHDALKAWSGESSFVRPVKSSPDPSQPFTGQGATGQRANGDVPLADQAKLFAHR